MPKCGQIGAMRSALGVSTRSSCRRSGWPEMLSTSTVSPGSAPNTKIGSAPPSTTPSPRWPMRSMTRRSTTLRLDEKFPVAVAASDRRRCDAVGAPAEPNQKSGDVVADRGVDGRIAHDAFLDVAAAGLELRLDQRNERCPSFEDFSDSRHDVLERDEAYIHRGKIRLFGKARRVEAADIDSLHGDDIAAAAQARMQLIAADVDGVDTLRAAQNQNFSEAPGRGADIEADAAGHVETKMIECRRKLDAAARHIRMLGLGGDDRGGRDCLRRLAHRHAVGGHQARGNRGLGAGAAFEQAARDQQAICAFSGGHDG